MLRDHKQMFLCILFFSLWQVTKGEKNGRRLKEKQSGGIKEKLEKKGELRVAKVQRREAAVSGLLSAKEKFEEDLREEKVKRLGGI